jgi:hypothetical protein
MKQLAQQLTLPGTNGPVTVDGVDNFQFDTVGSVINKAVPFVFAIAGVGLLIMIIFAGFTLLTSAGDAKKSEKGKQQLTYSIVGFIVIFVAYWIVQLFGVIFGIDSITTIFR